MAHSSSGHGRSLESSCHSALDSTRPARKSGPDMGGAAGKEKLRQLFLAPPPQAAAAMARSQGRSRHPCTEAELILMSLILEVLLDYH